MVGILFWIWYSIGAVLLLFFQVPESLQASNGLFLMFYALYAMNLIRTGEEPQPLSSVPAAAEPMQNPRNRVLKLMLASVVIWLGGMSVEWIGVHTGLLFGDYAYSTILGPLAAGVPVTLGFAWIAVVGNAVLLTHGRAAQGRGGKLTRAVEAGMWAVLLDLVLDPVAHARGFWTWEAEGGWFGVPISNFVGWFAVGTMLSLLFSRLQLSPSAVTKGTRLYQAILLFFGLVGLRHGLAAGFGIALSAVLLAEGRLRYAGSKAESKV